MEVEESLDLPGAVQLTLPVATSSSGDLTYVSDSRFQPLVNVAVVATPGAGSAAGSPAAALGAAASALGIGGSGSPSAQCIFDGYLLSVKLRLTPPARPSPGIHGSNSRLSRCRSMGGSEPDVIVLRAPRLSDYLPACGAIGEASPGPAEATGDESRLAVVTPGGASEATPGRSGSLGLEPPVFDGLSQNPGTRQPSRIHCFVPTPIARPRDGREGSSASH